MDILHITSLFIYNFTTSRERIATKLSVFTLKRLISTPAGKGSPPPSPISQLSLRLTIFMSRTNGKIGPRRKWDGVLVPAPTFVALLRYVFWCSSRIRKNALRKVHVRPSFRLSIRSCDTYHLRLAFCKIPKILRTRSSQTLIKKEFHENLFYESLALLRA